jgi:N-glycosidase YbiA
MKTILFYDPKEEYGEFSNFYKPKNPIVIDGEKWVTTEHYFQAMKFRGKNPSPRMIEYSNMIKNSDTPMKTKMLANQKKGRFGAKWKINKDTDQRLVFQMIDEYKDLKIVPNWNRASIDAMVKGLWYKFTTDKHLQKLLLSVPDDAYIVEHTKRDKIWGDGGDGGTGTIGQNRLGKILTVISFILKYGDCSRMNETLRKKVIIDLQV